jgi:dTDP-4-dehydrorhamnose 3,5-epimerase
MSRFDFIPTPLSGLLLVERKTLGDSRGYLQRLWCQDEWQAVFGDRRIAQVNHTYTASTATVRGLHFQYPPYAEAKYVSCLRGRVLDVAVDLRAGSPTFLQWHAEELSAANRLSLFIPEGFAHGFQTLEDDCEMLYVHSAPYVAEAEDGVNAMDPRLGIAWPLPMGEQSPRDRQFAFLDHSFMGVTP